MKTHSLKIMIKKKFLNLEENIICILFTSKIIKNNKAES